MGRSASNYFDTEYPFKHLPCFYSCHNKVTHLTMILIPVAATAKFHLSWNEPCPVKTIIFKPIFTKIHRRWIRFLKPSTQYIALHYGHWLLQLGNMSHYNKANFLQLKLLKWNHFNHATWHGGIGILKIFKNFAFEWLSKIIFPRSKSVTTLAYRFPCSNDSSNLFRSTFF